MVDDVNFEGSRSSTDTSLPTLSNQIGWVTFDEKDNKDSICDNCMAEEMISVGNKRYISRLGEFKVLQFPVDPARAGQDVILRN